MTYCYENYDNDDVHFRLRGQVAKLSSLFAVALIFSIVLLLIRQQWTLPSSLVTMLVGAAWGGTSWWIYRRLARLRHVVWGVKVSDEEVIGYDYARRRITLPWREMRHVSLDEQGLRLQGHGDNWFEVPGHFDDFGDLSHNLAGLAERYGIPLHVDGRPWQEVNVYQLFPFLSKDPPADAPDVQV